MDAEKFDDVVEDIRRVAEEKGFILNHEIDAIVGNDFSADDIVILYDKLSEQKIDFFDSPEKARLKMDARKRREEKEEAKPEEDSKATIRYDDPVRMYLREMGKVPLLDRQGEVDIAMRIEAGQIMIAKAILSIDSPIRELQRLAKIVEKGEMRIDEVVQVESGSIQPSFSTRKDIQARFRPVRRIAALRKEIVEFDRKLRMKKFASKKANLEKSLDLRREKMWDEYVKLQINPKQLERIVEKVRLTRASVAECETKLAEYVDFIGLDYDELLATVRKLKSNKRRKSVKIEGKGTWSLDVLEDFQKKMRVLRSELKKIEKDENATIEELR